MTEKVKMCNDCRWCGWGLFLFSPEHRRCHHPISKQRIQQLRPAGDGEAFVGIEREYGACGRSGRLWNTDAKGNAV